MLIVSGGVSVGPYDVVRAAFEAIGRVELWRVAVQPGKPFAFGRSKPRESDGRSVLLFGLPGNPVSALVTFQLFVRPALERLSGIPSPTVDTDRAVTEDRLEKAAGRRGFLRVTVIARRAGDPGTRRPGPVAGAPGRPPGQPRAERHGRGRRAGRRARGGRRAGARSGGGDQMAAKVTGDDRGADQGPGEKPEWPAIGTGSVAARWSSR